MERSLNEGAEESTGELLSSTRQYSLLAPVDLDVRTFCRRALRNDLKDAAQLVFPQAEPERALIDLCRILDAKANRHLEAEWLRRWARRWSWFREALALYWAQDLARLDPEKEPERLAALQDSVEKLSKNVEIVARELADIRATREGRISNR